MKTKNISLNKFCSYLPTYYFFKVNLMHKYNENSTFNFQTQHTVMQYVMKKMLTVYICSLNILLIAVIYNYTMMQT